MNTQHLTLKTSILTGLLASLLVGCATQRHYNSDWATARGNFQRTAAVDDAPHPPLQEKWVFETKGRIVYAPAVFDNTVYLGSRDSHLYAIRLTDGAEIWSEELEQGGIFQSPTVTEDSIYTGKWSPYYFVHAWQRSNGEMLWSRQTGELVNRPPWVLVEDQVLYTHIDPPYASAAELKAIATAWDLSAGQTSLWETPLRGIPEQAPALSKELLLLATDDQKMQALERSTGAVRWSATLASRPVSAPLLDGEQVIVATESGFVYAFWLKDGKTAWRYQFQEGRLNGDLALKDRTLYVPGERYLYSFDLRNLEPGWKFRAPNTLSAPVVSEQHVFIGCANQMLYVLDRQRGYVAGLYRIGGELLAPPVLAGGLVLVGSSNGKLYAYEERPQTEQKQAPNRLNQRW